jgi:hypothetical protein
MAEPSKRPTIQLPTDAVIIFLAYDGVWQPNIWKLWLRKAAHLPEASHMHLAVHAPEEMKKNKRFEKKYDINRFPEGDSIQFEKTGWCKMSIVIETLKAFQKVYLHFEANQEKYPRVQYYLVSGACIPVKPLKMSLIVPYITSLRVLGNNYSHSQWMSLTHPVMGYLLKESIKPKTILKTNNDITDNFVDIYLSFNCYNNKKYCPDEFMIGNLLAPILNKNKIVWRNRLTMHQWKVDSGNAYTNNAFCDGSPITWKDADKTYNLRDVGSGFTMDIYGVEKKLYASIRTLLLYSRMYPNIPLKEEGNVQMNLEVYGDYVGVNLTAKLRIDSKEDYTQKRPLIPLGFFMRKISRSLPYKKIKPILNLIYSEGNYKAIRDAFIHQRRKDIKRVRGDYRETLREDTILARSPSSPPKTEVGFFSGISRPILNVFTDVNDAPVRAFFYQPIRDANFDIQKMEDAMTQGDSRFRDVVIQEKIDNYRKTLELTHAVGGRRRRSSAKPKTAKRRE